MKLKSRIFDNILDRVISGEVPNQFRVADLSFELGKSLSFLSKHSVDPNDPSKKSEGNAYFIRVNTGLYSIHSNWLN